MLVDRLVEIQKAAGLDDTEFAARAGLPYSTWRALKAREPRIKRPGLATLSRVLRAFPELKPVIIEDLGKAKEKQTA